MQNELESNRNPNGTPQAHVPPTQKNLQHCSVVVSMGSNRTIKSIDNVHNYNTDLYVQAEEYIVLIRFVTQKMSNYSVSSRSLT